EAILQEMIKRIKNRIESNKTVIAAMKMTGFIKLEEVFNTFLKKDEVVEMFETIANTVFENINGKNLRSWIKLYEYVSVNDDIDQLAKKVTDHLELNLKENNFDNNIEDAALDIATTTAFSIFDAVYKKMEAEYWPDFNYFND